MSIVFISYVQFIERAHAVVLIHKFLKNAKS